MPELISVTNESLPRVLLEMVPEAAPMLACLAVEAFEVDPPDIPKPPPAKPREPTDPPRSIMDVVNSYRQPAWAREQTAKIGSRLQVAYGSYRVMSQFTADVLMPALDLEASSDPLDRCCAFIEAVLRSGKPFVDVVYLQILENSGLDSDRLSRLTSHAGPLLQEQLRRFS
jgi:hypothetical protein